MLWSFLLPQGLIQDFWKRFQIYKGGFDLLIESNYVLISYDFSENSPMHPSKFLLGIACAVLYIICQKATNLVKSATFLNCLGRLLLILAAVKVKCGDVVGTQQAHNLKTTS